MSTLLGLDSLTKTLDNGYECLTFFNDISSTGIELTEYLIDLVEVYIPELSSIPYLTLFHH
jgi:hypothetical protein